jgi:hypothetical protein
MFWSLYPPYICVMQFIEIFELILRESVIFVTIPDEL